MLVNMNTAGSPVAHHADTEHEVSQRHGTRNRHFRYGQSVIVQDMASSALLSQTPARSLSFFFFLHGRDPFQTWDSVTLCV